ncbi:TraR/DksA family transcriptional regulator [Streptomyces candidus]|uniref:RNA polymerase-binding transcription factor DksA n=1 Tax=Streptomyces candidus TaxID=67283 RepID=A0A7X0HA76_9ACTN|nr:TraR/DksA C4-type zinc finger protein [Streptomyces candidus]MBB6433721.1 RNA polymerase-binding transcription factor DksA [Streptomyces candidus]GHH34852.1 hypothetical protein GCM10018773_07590 [Streptomyces candidus]
MVADKTAGTKKTASKRTTGAAAGKQSAEEEQSVGASGSEHAVAPVKRAAAGKTAKKAAKKAPAAKTAETAVKKAAAKRAVAGKTASAAPAGEAGTQAAPAAEAAAEAAETGAETVVAKKSPGGAATAGKQAVPAARATTGAVPGELAVRPGEDPWTPAEVSEARAELDSEILRLRAEIAAAEEALSGLMRDSGDGAGDDDADTGTKNITREHEMSLAANAREMLEQTEHARDRLDAWTYGVCENCGKPIGKARMQAFPRATLCVECKQKQERRY